MTQTAQTGDTQPALSPDNSADNSAWSALTWTLLLAALTLLTFLVQGYHPLAEDGGVYVAGVEYLLDPALFPHYTAFVREPLHYSIFAPMVAALVRLTHLSLPWMLLLLDLFTIWFTLFAARQVLRRCVHSASAQLAGVALFAAWWTLPVAGTSLMLMDPYVTARSFSMPLSLLAIAFAMDKWPHSRLRPLWLCILCLAIAATLHPLMAAYALAFVLLLRATLPRRHVFAWITLGLAALAVAAALQEMAPAESPALVAAEITRYYWFLSQWHWYELLGLAGPIVILALLLRFRRNQLTVAAATLCRTCLVLGFIALLVALLFAHESAPVHLVARLQVLRVYLLLYAVMAMLLGATLLDFSREALARIHAAPLRAAVWISPAIFILVMAAVMGLAQQQTYPASPHVELPWRTAQNPNPWVRAFLWARANTPRGALFALDAKYVNTAGEDAQTFRATALRSALPDYSKDGGEASIAPSLATEWQQAATAQKDLSEASITERDARLRPFGVTWMVLHSSAPTAHPCPYNNGTVKVCRL